MALIQCTECGKEFSDKASSCPNCGCPVTHILQLNKEVNTDALPIQNRYRETSFVGLSEGKMNYHKYCFFEDFKTADHKLIMIVLFIVNLIKYSVLGAIGAAYFIWISVWGGIYIAEITNLFWSVVWLAFFGLGPIIIVVRKIHNWEYYFGLGAILFIILSEYGYLRIIFSPLFDVLGL